MKLFVTGGCGFLGSNLVFEAIARGYQILVFDNLSRNGAQLNFEWLSKHGNFDFIHGDVRNYNDVERAIKLFKPDAVFHLAGQVAMTTSIANVKMDFETNVIGSFNVLESVRQYAPNAGIIYSSTNKVYGDLEQFYYKETDSRYECIDHPNGFDENIQLSFHSPYGCSKGAADQYMLDYSRIFGIKTVVFRHSTMYGGRQFATYDQGWVGWFCQKAIEAANGNSEPFSISGTGKQVRDVLHANDMKQLYFSAIENIENIAGQVFNIGGGINNSLSLIELFSLLERLSGVELKYKNQAVRESDQKVFVADIQKIKSLLGWMPVVVAEEGIAQMYEWSRILCTEINKK